MDIAIDPDVTPEEIVRLRIDNGWDGELKEWKQCLRNILCIVSARKNGALVGVGMITGTIRHAELVDLVVDKEFTRNRQTNCEVTKFIRSQLEH